MQLRVLQSEHELEMKEMLGQAAEFDTLKGQMGERIKMLEMQKQQMTSEQEAKY